MERKRVRITIIYPPCKKCGGEMFGNGTRRNADQQTIIRYLVCGRCRETSKYLDVQVVKDIPCMETKTMQ
jgi:hypothetical protein